MNLQSHSLPRILFVGDDWYGSNATSLRNAILRKGHECLTFDSTPMKHIHIAQRLLGRSSPSHPSIAKWNRTLVSTIKAWRPDILLVFKGLCVTNETLAETSATCIHYHPDDSTNPENRSPVYAIAERHYDLHVTTKSFNLDELEGRGVSRALYVPCAYDRDWHRRATRARGSQYSVGFIGTRRPDRSKLIHDVADEWKRDFLLCGTQWRRDPSIARKATVWGPQYGFNLSLAVGSAPIQLGLLNSANRDQHTCRSFEIPAAGGLLIAERTDEHLAMLEEGKEALFFSSYEELKEHLSRLASEPKSIRHMGEAADKRIRSGHNSYDDRWDTMLEAVK
jgi:spore maturation protein CgeB